jgi:hypothetical protein
VTSENDSEEIPRQCSARYGIVISGASAGLRPRDSTGLRTRSEGARIGLIARGQDGLEGARRDVESLGGQALILQADVADADAVEAAPNGLKVESELGPIKREGNETSPAGVFRLFSIFGLAKLAADTQIGLLHFLARLG